MSEVKVNKISPRTACGTTTLGDSGDTFTVPSGVTITNSGTATGFGRTGTVDWQTDSIKTATFTAATGEGYFCNTTSGTFEVDLPAGAAGSIVSVQDYNNTFDSNALTVDPDGSEKINGGAAGEPISLTTEGKGVTFVYVDSTVGWRSVQENEYATGGESFLTATGGTPCAGTTCGDYKIHKFTGPGTFCVSAIGSGDNNIVSYLVVAGGGGGGSSPNTNSGAPGGAGGFREVKGPVDSYTASPLDGVATPANLITVSATPYPIGVGGGGAGSPNSVGIVGVNSTFSSITAAGGGNGGAMYPSGPAVVGGSGGSGGGSGGGGTGTAGGVGNTPPTTPPQGQNGGGSRPAPGPSYDGSGGGGGGAGGAGSPSPNGSVGGAGGAHVNTSISGADVEYSGGSGGAGTPSGAGTPGGGGAGIATSPTTCATAGSCNTGGSGGGSYNTTVSGQGGSGVVIIRYKFQ